MNKLNIKFKHCYGIKKLEHEFKFSNRTFSIYAPNGVMKTSFAKTFKDFSMDEESKDIPFPERETIREIVSDTTINQEDVFVIEPYNEDYESEKISKLLANVELKKEYELIHKEISKAKNELLKKIKDLSRIGVLNKIEAIIEDTFEKDFFDVLVELEREISESEELPFVGLDYQKIFNANVIKFLGTKDFKDSIKDYIEKYDELVSKSTYLKKEFSFYHAENVQSQLSSNNFFKAGHSVNLLNGSTKEEYVSDEDFKKLLEDEKKRVLENAELQTKFEEINKKLTNADLRTFRDYLLENKEILPELSNIKDFEMKIWKAYFINQKELFLDLVSKFKSGQGRIKELITNAKKEKTTWEEVVRIFNTRFSHLPFCLTIINKDDVILKDEVPIVGFTFRDGENEKEYEDRGELLGILSTGEKRALYLLNIIFEVEARKKQSTETIFIIDDIADSFDYKNKYAIIEYLKYMSEISSFYMIIMTHNFDFYRTIRGRLGISWHNCLFATKNGGGIVLNSIIGENIINPFTGWKEHLGEAKKLIASIPFIRNIIEYTQNEENPDYLLLTSVLHHKRNSEDLTLNDLKTIFEKTIEGISFPADNLTKNVFEFIFESADSCLTADEGINLENKIVLSIAIRLKSEQFMKSKITDETFLRNLDSSKNQTWTLLNKYQEEFNNENEIIEILKKVNLITPENIHVNSFMYEPILDMGDNELRDLYRRVREKCPIEESRGPSVNEGERARIRDAMERYCELDTLAEVEIVGAMGRVGEN